MAPDVLAIGRMWKLSLSRLNLQKVSGNRIWDIPPISTRLTHRRESFEASGDNSITHSPFKNKHFVCAMSVLFASQDNTLLADDTSKHGDSANSVLIAAKQSNLAPLTRLHSTRGSVDDHPTHSLALRQYVKVYFLWPPPLSDILSHDSRCGILEKQPATADKI